MQFDPRAVVATFVVLWLVLSAGAMAIWWTRRRYAGFGRWLIADLALFLALCLLSLRPNAPDWVSVVCANAVIVLASVLLLEGARVFRGQSPRVWSAYVGGFVTIGVLTFFLYGVPSLNARAAVMSAFVAVIFSLSAITLLRGVRPSYTFGLRTTAAIFAMCAATHFARAAYCAFGPPLNDLFSATLTNRAFFIATSAQMALLPVGFMLLAEERVIAELLDSRERVDRANAEVAERRETEAVLRESERRFRQLADAAPLMIWSSGANKGCTYVNRSWLEFTGRSLDAELGSGWADCVHSDDRARCLATYQRAFDSREPLRMEYRLRRHDGTYRWILDHGAPVTGLHGDFAGYVGSAVDITDQREAKEALSNLSRKLMEVQEAERTWIARELHDDLAQRAVGLAIQLYSMAQSDGSVRSADLTRTSIEVNNLSRDIQRMAHSLHSAKLEILGLGLTSAAESLCRDLSDRHQKKIDFSHDGVPPLSDWVALCLFRVLQEALANAIKHAGVAHIEVALVGSLTDVQLHVRDRGAGFDPDSTSSKQGLGFISMKERLNLVGGEIHIESKPDAGTAIRARIPLIPRGNDEMAL